jgi:hypothetical protein
MYEIRKFAITFMVPTYLSHTQIHRHCIHLLPETIVNEKKLGKRSQMTYTRTSTTPCTARIMHDFASTCYTPETNRTIKVHWNRHQKRRIVPIRPLDVSAIQSPGFCKPPISQLTLCELLASTLLRCLTEPFMVEGKDGVVIARVSSSE